MESKEKRGRKRTLPRDGDGKYYCEICASVCVQKPFDSYFARYIHIERHHKPAKIHCLYPNCNVLFKSHFQRDRHFITKHASDVIEKKKK